MGPARTETQTEVAIGDCLKLEIKGKVKMSGDIHETSEITLIEVAVQRVGELVFVHVIQRPHSEVEVILPTSSAREIK